MGKNRVTRGDAIVGKLSASGNISSASGTIQAPNGIGSTLAAVNAGSPGFTMASVALRMVRVPVSAATTGERTYAFTFPVGAIVKEVYLDVSVGESTASNKTIDIGLLATETNGDNDGFLDGVSTASIAGNGPVQGSVLTVGSTRGLLLLQGSATSQDVGRKFHIVSGANAVTLASKLAEAQTELVADIVIEFLAVG